ncbi:MAG: hypothetical protein ABIK07_07905 [Planctomycetota bacterium]
MSSSPPPDPAVQAILNHQWYESVKAAELRTRDNPSGDGTFVWVEQSLLHDSTKVLAWLVVDGTPYALNRDSKTLTRTPWPNDAPGDVWKRTGLPPSIRITDDTSAEVDARNNALLKK